MNSLHRTSLRTLALLGFAAGGLALGGCAEAVQGGGGADGAPVVVQADASVGGGNPDAAIPLPQADAAVASVTTTLQSTATNTLTAGNSIGCPTGEQHYLRTYPLADSGITTDFAVTSVDVGIENATSTGASQPVDVSLHTLSGTLLLANLTQISTTTVQVTPQAATILNVPITGVIPAGSTLVVEVHTVDGEAAGDTFFIGSNTGAETTPSFLVGPACSNPEPTPANDLVAGLTMSVILNVTGDHTSP